uniref:DUF3668 domain-containing protein n=1 Tax=Anopheles melas TaxID=34690 RepID=A0A182TX39_9DIPT
MEPPHKDDEQQLVIFVQVLGGIHFQQEKQGRKIALTASLNQQVFEAVSRRPVTPGSGTASFDVKLVWQCDRYTLKSIKTKNTPIKLDCYEVQPSGVRSPIGSVVIPLRSVPVVTLSRIKTIKPRWYRLVGIESERWRRIKPELKLLVMVADSQHLDQCQVRDDSSTPDLSGDELLTKRSAPKPETLSRNVELLEDRGLLQVGCKDTETDLFVFEIVLKCAQHLDRLCPGTDTFRLQYELFGERHVSMAERTKSGSPVFDVKAKIRINLRSSILTLVDYFDNGFKMAIMVLTGGEEEIRERTVGTTTIDFVGFLKTNHLALQHPKADTPFTKVRLELLPDVAVYEDRIEFGGVTLELFFSTLPDKVVDIIGSEPSKLTLNGPHSTYALARLDNESLLVGTRERQPTGVVVMINEAGENVAIASISCALEEVGLNYNSQLGMEQEEPTRQDCCHSAAPQTAHGLAKRFDATVAYQLVEKQKLWMHEQRQQFMEQLEEKERKHLQALEQSWKKRQAETEKRLADRLARADALAAALEEAHRKAKTRVPEDGPRVEQIEQQFKAQLEEIRAKAVRLEQEAEAQIETTRRQCREFQQQQAQLSISQQQLLDSNRTLQSELDQERASRAAVEQQLEELAESKQHYKELWAKLTRKVHQLQEELSMARTPYFQAAPAKDARKGRRKIVASSSSQMSVVRGGPRQGAGDCCNVCDCSDGSD